MSSISQSVHLFSLLCSRCIQAFLDFRGFDFRDFRFNTVYNSILFSSPLVPLSNLDLNGFCFCGFFLCPYINGVNRGMPVVQNKSIAIIFSKGFILVNISMSQAGFFFSFTKIWVVGETDKTVNVISLLLNDFSVTWSTIEKFSMFMNLHLWSFQASQNWSTVKSQVLTRVTN